MTKKPPSRCFFLVCILDVFGFAPVIFRTGRLTKIFCFQGQRSKALFCHLTNAVNHHDLNYVLVSMVQNLSPIFQPKVNKLRISLCSDLHIFSSKQFQIKSNTKYPLKKTSQKQFILNSMPIFCFKKGFVSKKKESLKSFAIAVQTQYKTF